MRTKLRHGEKVILILRKHWFSLVPFIIFVIFSFSFTFYLINKINVSETTTNFFWLITIFPLLILIYKIIERKHNIWGITNYRIIDEAGIISRYFKESPLNKINNTSYKQTILGRIFGYGDIAIQTAAKDGETIFKFVSNPKAFIETLQDSIEDFQDKKHL